MLTAQSVLTLVVIMYDQVAPQGALLFYNVYGEIILEAVLVILWATSFSGMASYVTTMKLPVSLIQSWSSSSDSSSDNSIDVERLANNSQTSLNICIAISVAGSIVLCAFL